MHRAAVVEATDLIALFIIGALPSVIDNPDRYGRARHRFDTEVPPLLRLLIGSRLENFNTFFEFTSTKKDLGSAIDAAQMCLIPISQELSDYKRQTLKVDFDTVVKQMRSLEKQPPTFWASRSNGEIINLLSMIGRLRHASHLAVEPRLLFDLHPLAKGWRLIRAYDRALPIAERMVEMDPNKNFGYIMRAAILADMGEDSRSHIDAQKAWKIQEDTYSASVLARTSKNNKDTTMFAIATGFLGPKKAIDL